MGMVNLKNEKKKLKKETYTTFKIKPLSNRLGRLSGKSEP
jgi:hypothetical protein